MQTWSMVGRESAWGAPCTCTDDGRRCAFLHGCMMCAVSALSHSAHRRFLCRFVLVISAWSARGKAGVARVKGVLDPATT